MLNAHVAEDVLLMCTCTCLLITDLHSNPTYRDASAKVIKMLLTCHILHTIRSLQKVLCEFFPSSDVLVRRLIGFPGARKEVGGSFQAHTLRRRFSSQVHRRHRRSSDINQTCYTASWVVVQLWHEPRGPPLLAVGGCQRKCDLYSPQHACG